MSDTITRQTPTWAELQELLAKLGPNGRTEVDTLEAQAVAYVWGRQDAGESARDTGYSIDFGRAFAWHAARYRLELICYRNNIETAFKRWSKGEAIEKPY